MSCKIYRFYQFLLQTAYRMDLRPGFVEFFCFFPIYRGRHKRFFAPLVRCPHIDWHPGLQALLNVRSGLPCSLLGIKKVPMRTVVSARCKMICDQSVQKAMGLKILLNPKLL